MNGMNGYYDRQYAGVDQRRSMDAFGPSNMAGLGLDQMEDTMMAEGQTLDDIINQNNSEIQRRRSSQHAPYRNSSRDTAIDAMRRASMMEFGSDMNTDLNDFQFDPNPAGPPPIGSRDPNMLPLQNHTAMGKAQSRETLALDTGRYQAMPSGYETLPSSATYASPMDPASAISLNATNHYMNSNNGGMQMDFGMPGGSSGDVTPMNMYSHGNYQSIFTESPTQQHMQNSLRVPSHDPGGGASPSDEQAIMDKVQQMTMPASMSTYHHDLNRANMFPANEAPTSPTQDTSLERSSVQQPTAPNMMQPPTQNTFEISGGQSAKVASDAAPGPAASQFPNAYSSSGFDMLGVLMRVAGRPNPEINIGPVDMSCAFVVCDISRHDLPIAYCSDVFERLTGYTKHEILGRNCRFLQAPDGKVQAGIKRKYVDDKSVLMLKNKIGQRSEVQLSLINYRKGGQPFMNLLTMIPVTWDTDEFRYYVGFQVDLVEQPNSIAGRNPDGSYAINYQRGTLPNYILPTPDLNSRPGDLGQTIGREEVSTVLSTIGQGESELSKRIWDKVLLENTDDVVHVLSLKGLFLYLSPASRKVLEYDASELVGTALSAVCHPSDIVPVTRELKDTTSGATVNVVYRIRRKVSGYTWFEAHGALHTEQGKGRKCIILVGRERPVYALGRNDIMQGGGMGESELWTKMSTSGMFLYISSNVRTLLDRTPEDLIGTSIQALMRPESKVEFGRILEAARTGKKLHFKHDMQNRRGQVLQAQTTVYPGDAVEGTKPTFLVAQTRLFKLSRSLLTTNRPNATMSPKTDQASAGSVTPSSQVSGASGAQGPPRNPGTPQSPQGNMYDTGILTQPGGSGLMLGNQAEALASEENIFDELKTTRSTSWQFELRQMEKQNRLLSEELQGLLARKKKRKRRKGAGQMEKDCANCHTRVTPEWRRGPSGNRDLCNSCGLRWAKQHGRVSPRKSSADGEKSISPTDADDKIKVEKGVHATPNENSHEAKTARMEATARQGFGGGIAEKVEEESEADEASGLS